jgi:hypothetical protein
VDLVFQQFILMKKYDFITYEGFDYDSKLDGMSKQILTQFYIDKIIDFYQADASENLLDQDKPYTLFLF